MHDAGLRSLDKLPQRLNRLLPDDLLERCESCGIILGRVLNVIRTIWIENVREGVLEPEPDEVRGGDGRPVLKVVLRPLLSVTVFGFVDF